MFSLTKIYLKIYLFIGGFLLILSLLGLHSCRQKAKEKALIKHNNEKRDEKIKQSVKEVENKQEIDKIEFEKMETITEEEAQERPEPTKEEMEKKIKEHFLRLEGQR